MEYWGSRKDVKALFFDQDFNHVLTIDDIKFRSCDFLIAKNEDQEFRDEGSYILPIRETEGWHFHAKLYLIEWNFGDSDTVNAPLKAEGYEQTSYYRLDGTKTAMPTAGVNIKTTADKQGHLTTQKFIEK